MSKVKGWPNDLKGGRIGSGWYQETEQDIENQRLADLEALSLKQKLDEVFALIQLRHKERRNAIKKVKEQKSLCE